MDQSWFQEMMRSLVEKDTIVPIMAIALGCMVAIFAILITTIKSLSETKAREKTRSEVAAYVAEGSMTADEGERLLRAEPNALVDGVRTAVEKAGLKGFCRSSRQAPPPPSA